MNIYIVNILTLISSIIVGYIFGSIPTGVIIGKVFFHKDPRDYGSKNPGGTNSGRVFGRKIGILVTALDMLKTLIAVYGVWAIVTFTNLSQYFSWSNGFDAKPVFIWVAGFFAAVGHCFSIFLHFKGGKAVACFMALCIGTSWVLAIVALAFLIVVKLTDIVSLSSLISGLLEVIAVWIIVVISYVSKAELSQVMWSFGLVDGLVPNMFYAFTITFTYMILFYRHLSNIQRLAEGKENHIDY